MARAALLLVGSEMTDPGRPDANGPYARARLGELGIPVVLVARVEDRVEAIAAAVRGALESAEVVIASGGLGPTGDDLTREGAGAALGRAVVEDPGWVAELTRRVEGLGRPLTEAGRRQALILEGSEALANPAGFACGTCVERDGHLLVLLPGVPREFRAILDTAVMPRLALRFPVRPEVRVVRAVVAGLPEATAEETLKPWYGREGVEVSILPSAGVLHITYTLTAPPASGLGAVEGEVRADLARGLGAHLVSLEGRELEEALGDALLRRKATVALAESCTGGLAAHRVASVPGASRYFLGSVTAYANEAKRDLLGVPAATLQAHGAVSAETALAMARGARARFLATWAVSTTGVAGPDGGSEEKPVGTVFAAVVGPGYERAHAFRFPGERALVMRLSANYALYHLWRAVKEAAP